MLLVVTSDALVTEDDFFVGDVFQPTFGKLCSCLKLYVVCYFFLFYWIISLVFTFM